ncbi:hypothetical protein IJE86_07755 [bacterium]|nr:hypothetical protein [bacterium]
MGNVTLGQIVIFLAQIAGVIASIGAIVGVVIKLTNWIKKKRKEQEINPILDEIQKIYEKIDSINQNVDGVKRDMSDKMDEAYKQMNDKIDSLEINQCKDVIVDFVTDIKSGRNVASKEARAYEAYDKYINVYHQNSYIHKLWEDNVNTTKE